MSAALLAGVLLLAVPDSVEAPCPGGAVVSRADLEAAGATTLHDAFRLTLRLDGVTTDGFDREPVAGVGVPFAQPVRVFVDGAPATRGAGPEPPGLEALPVALGEVEAVVVCPGAGVAGGAYGGPWVDVRTAAPARAAYAAAAYGNEAGDPGPLRYLDPDLPNVDKLGPDFEAAVVGRAGRGAGWMVLRDRDYLPTDPAILDRTRVATTRYPKRYGPIVAVATRAAGLRARLGVRWVEDLPFVPAVGREVAVSHTSAQATVAGDRAWGRLRVWGHGHAAQVVLDRPSWSALPLDPAWNERRLEAAVASSLEAGGGAVSAGVQAETADVEAGPFASAVGVGRAWAEARAGGDAGGAALTLAGAAGGGLGVGLGARAWWRPGPGLTLWVEGSARRSLPEERRGLDAWAARGYRGLDAAALGALAVEALGRVDVARARLAAEVRRGPAWASASVEGQRVGGAAWGTAALARFEAGARGLGLRLRAEGRAQGALGGSAAFVGAWDRLPGLRGALDVTAPLDGRASLWARLEARSDATWTAGEVPSMVLLDLGVGKRAWGDRLRLSITGRNVLAAEERTHPLGAVLDPRLFVRAEATL